MTEQKIPEGYFENAKGELIPERLVKPIDIARDELVRELAAEARHINQLLAKFKRRALDDVQAFVQLSAEKYDAKLGGDKGNVSLQTFDGSLKLVRSVSENITFTEQLHAAKALIDSCIHRWAEGSRAELKVLIDRAFQTDKQGKINTQRVLELRSLEINDPEWKQAMEAINDSISISSTRSYIRVYERRGEDYVQLPLDIAGVK